jgi:dihydropyrimidinase
MESYLDCLPRYLEVASRSQVQDFAVHLTMFHPGQTLQMEACLREFGVTSFKVYMMLRGALGRGIVMDQLAEDAPLDTADVDFDNGHLYDVFRTASTLPARVRVNVHSEDADIVAFEIRRVQQLGWDGLTAWHAARPGHSEAIAIQTVGYLAQQFDVPAYFPHVGSRQAVAALEDLRARGVPFVAETCPHYLALTTESEVGTLAKITPPIRTEDDAERVWEAVQGETITTFGSDHIAYTDLEKQLGPVWTTRAAFGGTGLILPFLLSGGLAEGRLTITHVARLTSYESARAFGLYPRKGTLLPGADADFAVLDLEKEWIVRSGDLGSGSEFSVYEGMPIKGRVDLTAVRGSVVYRDGRSTGRPGHGRYFRRFPEVAPSPDGG